MTTPAIRLTNCDVEACADTIRLALHIGGVAFDDARVPGDDAAALKRGTLFGGLPVMTIDGVEYGRTNALLRYAAAIGEMEPAAPIDRLNVDQVVEAVNDVVAALVPSLCEQDLAAKLALRKALVKTTLPPLLTGIERVLERNDATTTGYTCGSAITIADLSLWSQVLWFRSGMLDGIPSDFIDAYPAICRVVATVSGHPQVVEWFKRHPQQ
ncbi:GST C-terminal domain-containing protein [Plasmodiophora brassicae]|uniref:GST C-terminal domain-containing protein n=1 Tax=Plasmodiophora brassicae TaxID=37360 RepID=A0A0G4J4H6_PLABS|nr:hypothetical protein PBRA_009069 [Plasmodiophora brassicae]